MNALVKKEAASRQTPALDVHRDLSISAARARQAQEARRGSEMRMQAAVVGNERKQDDADVYADVPCTD